MTEKPRLQLIYEDRAQISTTPFTDQLYKTLEQAFRLTAYSRRDIVEGRTGPAAADIRVLSILKQRAWRRAIPFLARHVALSGVYLYDQDPWEAYMDDASSPGVYKLIASLLPVRSFLVTSPWWADYIRREDGLETDFVRMGVLPSMCDVGPRFEERPHVVAFQGTVHAHRQAFFDRMRSQGVGVQCLERVSFSRFLDTVQQVGVFLCDDSGGMRMGGSPASFHGLWGTCLTVAARGCFVIRNHDLAMEAYGIDELPAVFAFGNEAEVPAIVERIRVMEPSERQARVEQTVARLRERNDWMTVAEAVRAA